jgi:PhoH-like ATPase
MADHHSGTRKPASNKQVSTKVTTKSGTIIPKGGHSKKKVIPVAKQSIPIDLRRLQKEKEGAITYVPDTNVIMTSWDCLFKFEEHDVCIVSQVWKELDAHKKGHSSEAWNSRKAIHAIDTLVAGKTPDEIRDGIPLIPPKELMNGKPHNGKLFLDFSKSVVPTEIDIELSLNEPDDRIIMICLALKSQGKRVVLISNDGNCRVKAGVAGIEAEEYLNEVATDIIGEEDLYTGFHYMPHDFWAKQGKDLKPVPDGKIFRYELSHPLFKAVNCNEFLIFPDGLKLMVVNKIDAQHVIAETFTNFHHQKVSGITPLNLEQELALQLLTDERVRGVSLAGLAGSGKNFLAIGAALRLTYDLGLYERIIITRATIGSDEDIGFLPGTEEEKMDPWMGSLHDNLEILIGSDRNDEKNVSTGNDSPKNELTLTFLNSRIRVKSLNFMKGRTFNKTILIIDETQDLTTKKLKMIATRVGHDSKIIFLGNVAQIDDNYLTEHTCGMSVFIRAFADSTLTGHITLQQGVRSSFATEAEERL